MDRQWWTVHRREASKVFQGQFVAPLGRLTGVGKVKITAGNSGAGAILLAEQLGADQIILLGFDCQHTGGMAHWHGDHPPELANAGVWRKWPAQFERVASAIRADVVNCSRETALTVFRRGRLEDYLHADP